MKKDVTDFLKTQREVVESALRDYLLEEKSLKKLQKAMSYAVLSGGKRVRPILTILSFERCGGKDISRILPTACGIEFLHTFALIQDDLPSMDNDDMRRGKPTLHKAFDEATAILASDALFSLAFQLFSETPVPEKSRIAVIKEISEAIGAEGVVGGQILDLDRGKDLSPVTLRRLHYWKTAKLITASIKCGAILAQASSKTVEILEKAGVYMGMLFQITDDILDVISNEKILGKRTQKDIIRDRLTYPRIYGLGGARYRAVRYAKKAKSSFVLLGESFKVFQDITDFILTRSF